jgi:hypothetical protein
LEVQLSAVQALASSQSPDVLQQPAIDPCWQVPVPRLGLSVPSKVGAPVSVPFSAGVVESVAVLPSSKPQRPTSPVPPVRERSLLARISEAARARDQTRTSSMRPAKAPVAAPVELSAAPRPKCWMLS